MSVITERVQDIKEKFYRTIHGGSGHDDNVYNNRQDAGATKTTTYYYGDPRTETRSPTVGRRSRSSGEYHVNPYREHKRPELGKFYYEEDHHKSTFGTRSSGNKGKEKKGGSSSSSSSLKSKGKMEESKGTFKEKAGKFFHREDLRKEGQKEKKYGKETVEERKARERLEANRMIWEGKMKRKMGRVTNDEFLIAQGYYEEAAGIEKKTKNL